MEYWFEMQWLGLLRYHYSVSLPKITREHNESNNDISAAAYGLKLLRFPFQPTNQPTHVGCFFQSWLFWNWDLVSKLIQNHDQFSFSESLPNWQCLRVITDVCGCLRSPNCSENSLNVVWFAAICDQLRIITKAHDRHSAIIIFFETRDFLIRLSDA